MPTIARGRHVELCLWERDPAGETTVAPDDEHDHVVYLQSGALIVTIGDDPPLELHARDSFEVPAGVRYRFEVLEPATVVEAIGPAPNAMT
jgi:uncharacterized cupin superfamily protein